MFKLIYKHPNKKDKNKDYEGEDYEEEEGFDEKDYKKNNEKNDEEDNFVDLKILGSEFVKNNKNKGKLIINNKKYNFTEFIKIQNVKYDNIKVIIIFSNFYVKGNYMFEQCKSLIHIYDYIINNDEYKFNGLDKNESNFEYEINN